MSRSQSFTYEYQGSCFHLEQGGWYLGRDACEITGIVTESEKLFLPDTYNGNPIRRWDMQNKEKPLSAVRRMEKSCCTALPQAIRRGRLCQIQ